MKGEALGVATRTGERARHSEGFMKLDRTPAVTAVIMSDISGFVKEMYWSSTFGTPASFCAV
jgi:hypothetical protein